MVALIEYGTIDLDTLDAAIQMGVVNQLSFFDNIIQTMGPPDNRYRWIRKHIDPTSGHLVGAISALRVSAGFLQWTALKLKEGGIDINYTQWPDEAAWRAEVESWEI